MDILKSIFLGIVQGATEFLPVSSSAHLVFSQHYLGFDNPQILFDVLLHFATLMAVLAYFRRDIKDILTNFYKIREIKVNRYCRTFWLIVIGAVPTAIIGYALRNSIEETFGSVISVALLLVVTGFVLLLSDNLKNKGKDEIKTGIQDVIFIGIAQGLAVFPGISRSGITIVAAVLIGLNRGWAAKFSLLLSIPVIFGATLLELMKSEVVFNGHMIAAYLSGLFAAFIVGYLSLSILIKVLESRKLRYFSFYCWFVALFVIITQLI